MTRYVLPKLSPDNGVVLDVITPPSGVSIHQMYHPDYVARMHVVPDSFAGPLKNGDTFNKSWVSPPPPDQDQVVTMDSGNGEPPPSDEGGDESGNGEPPPR